MGEDAPKTGFSQASTILEFGSKAILIAYGVGFFIESYFDAKFGVTYLNPFRSRIAFTGIGLLIQVALVVAVINAERVWGVNSSYWAKSAAENRGGARIAYQIPMVVSWLIEAAALGFIVRFLFAFHLQETPAFLAQATAQASNGHSTVFAIFRDHASVFVAGISIFSLLTLADIIKISGKRSKLVRDTAAVVAVATGLLFVAAEWKLGDPLVLIFAGYIIIVRLGFMLYRSDPQFRCTERRIALIGFAILLPTFYAQWIYPQVLPQWGGAAKTKLWIEFSEQVIPFGIHSPAYLLEETEEGYYLLRSKEEKPNADSGGPIIVHPPDENVGVGAMDHSSVSKLEAETPNPSAYSAIYIPRKEVREVLYEHSTSEDQ